MRTWAATLLALALASCAGAPAGPYTSDPAITRFGFTGHVVVAELADAPAA